jgi:hypothetical protein
MHQSCLLIIDPGLSGKSHTNPLRTIFPLIVGCEDDFIRPCIVLEQATSQLLDDRHIITFFRIMTENKDATSCRAKSVLATVKPLDPVYTYFFVSE